MLKEVENQEKITELYNVLESFLDGQSCDIADCGECKHKRLCDNIYRLDTTLRIRYLKK